MKLVKDLNALQVLWWAIVFAFLVVPTFALAMELGRFSFARAEMGKAADAAAEAAVTEVDYPAYVKSGRITLTDSAYGVAQVYVAMNTSFLGRYKIHPTVSAIKVNNGNKTVLVEVTADVGPLFPQFFGKVVVRESGTAQVRDFKR